MEDSELTRIFTSAGRLSGYDDVTAKFAAFREFKIRWTRNYKWIAFEVSDYLSDAPTEVLRPLADTIFSRIRGERSEYPDTVTDWLCSPEFVRTKQPLFVERAVGLSKSPCGKHRDLSESYGRLVDAGLVEGDRDVFMGWTAPSRSRSVGTVSVLMKVMTISAALDSPDVPERLVDYCLYAQAAHLALGFNPGTDRRGKEYDGLLSRFPERTEMESLLRRMSLHIRGGVPRTLTRPVIVRR